MSEAGSEPVDPAPADEARRPGDGHRPRRAFGRFLGAAALGTLIPGSGFIAAGMRRTGWFITGAVVVGFGCMAVLVVHAGESGLITIGSDPRAVRIIGYALLAVAGAWLLIAGLSLYAVQSDYLSGAQRLAGAIVVIVVSVLVVTPLAVGARYSFAHGKLVDTVFAHDDQRSLTVPTPAPSDDPEHDPWAGTERVDVLLLGGDGAPGRPGVRPDSQILASIDTRTGHTVLFSLPRNLQRVPFAADSPLDEKYPDGFNGPGDPLQWMLNAVYENVPALHPEVFEESDFPGADATKWAVEGALGIDVDYFVLVNIDGFQQIVDALGGVTIDVPYRIPTGTRTIPGIGCTTPSGWIEQGENRRLDGYHALWFARARCGPPPVDDDYDRMRRQRCLIGAIIDEADPMTLLRRYQTLADATRKIVLTDIPQRMLSAFVELSLKVKDATVTSLAFTDDVLSSRSNPDYEQIHQLVDTALAQAGEPSTGTDDVSLPGSGATPEPVGENGGATSPGTAGADSGDRGGAELDGAPGTDAAQPLEALC